VTTTSTSSSPDRLLSPAELAEYLGEPIGNIYARNHFGTGPKRIKIGRAVRYRLSDIEAWLRTREIDGAR
jgi:predicted DNA-binding transcriptional regulator AlpA